MIKSCEQKEDISHYISQTNKGVVLKHSTQCPISSRAHEHLQTVLDNHEQVTAIRVLVIEQRDVSQALAAEYDIVHQSPQIRIVDDGKITEVLNHMAINKKAIEQSLNLANSL